MIIKQNRVVNISRCLSDIKRKSTLIIGLSNLGRFDKILKRIGFTFPISNGDTLLPSAMLGPISKYNAEGTFIIHKDKPLETHYRQAIWKWKQWAGRNQTIEREKIVDIPYKRYPRTFVSPPSIEFTIKIASNHDLLLVTPTIQFLFENEDIIKHVINLFLEIFGECEIFTGDLERIKPTKIRRLNWEVLPQGKMPWTKVKKHVQNIVDDAPEGNQPIIRDRFETINNYQPNFMAIGKAGFRGYVVFGFINNNIFVLESIYEGNATYIFNQNWESLSQLTKAEILNANLQEDRIIHRKSWPNKIHKLLK